MRLNQHDRDRLLVAVHDGLDAVIGDKVRWKPRGAPSGAIPSNAYLKSRDLRWKQKLKSKGAQAGRERMFKAGARTERDYLYRGSPRFRVKELSDKERRGPRWTKTPIAKRKRFLRGGP